MPDRNTDHPFRRDDERHRFENDRRSAAAPMRPGDPGYGKFGQGGVDRDGGQGPYGLPTGVGYGEPSSEDRSWKDREDRHRRHADRAGEEAYPRRRRPERGPWDREDEPVRGMGGLTYDPIGVGSRPGYEDDRRRDASAPPRHNAGARGGPTSGGAGYGGGHEGERGPARNAWDKGSDEVASWFGNERAARRREWDHVRGEHAGKGPRGYSRSDERVREDVADRLTDDPWLDPSEIEVAVTGCEVTLNGTVGSRDDKRRAEDLAHAVSGVKHVQNNLRVGPAA